MNRLTDTAFAVIDTGQRYDDFYDELLAFIKAHFAHVQSGIQGDAWIWITEGDQKVAVDSFSAMRFEIKAVARNELLQRVIDTIAGRYPVRLYDPPREM